MNLTDLREELESHAHDANPVPVGVRLASVRTRIRVRRRRQAAAASLLVAGCVAAIGLGANLSAPQADRLPPPAGQEVIRPHTFDTLLAGDPLTASAVGVAGQREVELRFTPDDTNLMVAYHCHVEDDDSPLRGTATLNGNPYFSANCQNSTVANGSTTHPGGGRGSADPTAEDIRAAWKELGVVPGRESVLRITLEGPEAELERHGSSVRLGVALYEMSGERVVSDGLVIKKDAEVNGRNYRLAEYVTQPASTSVRTLNLAIPAGSPPAYVAGGTSNPDESDLAAESTIYVDGEQKTGGNGGSFGTPLDDAGPHSLEVRTGATSGVLMLAYYVRVDRP